jgi:hypothetical protein
MLSRFRDAWASLRGDNLYMMGFDAALDRIDLEISGVHEIRLNRGSAADPLGYRWSMGVRKNRHATVLTADRPVALLLACQKGMPR